MKKINGLFAAAVALLSAGAMAGLLQPVLPVNEDTPVRVNFGVQGGLNGTKGGFGLTSLDGGIGFTHDVNNDFTYGLAARGGVATSKYGSRLFTKDAKEGNSGFRLDVELMARYMPEMAQHLRAGLVLGLNWGDQFTGAAAKEIRDGRSFGDFEAKVGPAISYGFTPGFSGYVSAQYSFNRGRFGVKTEELKGESNWSGLDVPVGVWFGLADSTGLFIEANSRFLNFKKFTKSFREEVTLGVSYAI